MDNIYHKLLSIFKTLINILVVTLSLPTIITAKRSIIKGKGCINILGNGPSLKTDYPVLLSSLTEADSILVVNSFATTDLFEVLKPQYYFIVDPSFFMDKNVQIVADIKNATADALISKTKWKLHLFFPYKGRNSKFLQKLKENKLIEIEYFLNVPIYDGSEKVNHFLFKHNLANPPYRNVLIAAIFYSIKMNFSKIVIWGADHSWHEQIVLGKDNRVYTKDSHFYGEAEKGFVHCDIYGNPTKVHEELYNASRALMLYHNLEAFSHLYNCKIVNKSSKTWIDAFSRE
jgi:hypothetical protein